MSVFTARPVHLHPALTYLRLADLVCQTLTERGVDCVSLAWLSGALDVPVDELRTTVRYAVHLGICHGADGSVMYCLPRQPIAAGFVPVYRDGRMRLRLPGCRLRPALWLSGQRVGPVPEHERDGTTLGAGELAYTVCRLGLMAASWLPPSPDPLRYLFELVAEAWRHASGTRYLGGLGIHRAGFEAPIAFGPEMTNRLELVTNRHELVNLYPIPVWGADR